ncbi:uncharacterized protein J4E84_007810 [Alternaria hordeiaustralica]|uniref:uncharacterized protein n=1 Tax=Alternaria hordeiaustralica TaxID=1187925 RepID=UPI0020C3DF80|nr:uncharacterized protein J4E84_007810 [Alternaria hordeiaustralica]KAI4680671.1 hypothetical protein J4E84_007810 [Alternaria hordeiaustralica]
MFQRCARFIGFRNAIVFTAGLGVLLLCNSILLLWQFRSPSLPAHRDKLIHHGPSTQQMHPIDELMVDAQRKFEELISERTYDLNSAAEAYRQRRGRNPPPHFDAWFEYAQKHDAVIVEGLFDQIYRDLRPFWGVSAKSMRGFAQHYEHRISVRNGTATRTENQGPGTPTDRMFAWWDMVRRMEGLLPDLDIAVNFMDESRVIVPWEEMSNYTEIETLTRKILPGDETISEYGSFQALDETSGEPPQVNWIGPGEPYWELARKACPPDSPGRNQVAATNLAGPPPFPRGYPERSYKGYVQNWDLVRDACQQKHLQESHGTFIEPVSISTTHALVPIFGETKLQQNSDILIPPAAYLSEAFAGGDYSGTNRHGKNWSEKTAGAVWRGVASGGRNKAENWTRFHRHRFVSMLNGTYVHNLEMDSKAAEGGQTYSPQSYTTYHLEATRHMNMGTWLDRIANVGFTDLLCFPQSGKRTCDYNEQWFGTVKKIPMSKQFDYKLLPDIDGNSFSGRYLSFLRSTSVPIKATIYSEWHDDRLIPWLHFVPMDNSFVDMHAILDYFLGTGDDHVAVLYGAHDKAAEKIAFSGQEWANSVLRKEDMFIYTLRLLLEYARLCDDNREQLGFAGHVTKGSSGDKA